MTDRTAVPLEQKVYEEYRDNYARVIRLLLQGRDYRSIHTGTKLKIVQSTDELVVEGMTTCPKCKGRRVRTTEMQTRGCDESKTQFNLCVECKHQWKF